MKEYSQGDKETKEENKTSKGRRVYVDDSARERKNDKLPV